MRLFLTVAAILSIACADAAGQTYRWVDKEGRVHYTQTPPPPDARGVQKKSFHHGPVEAPDLPYATQVAAKNFPVTLYTQPDCGALCDQARALLVKRSVPFKEVSVIAQKEADEMKRLSGKNELPVLVVGAQVQTGFQANIYNDLLDSAGYPSSGPSVPVEALRKMDPAARPPAPAQAPQGAGAPPGSYSSR
ncbi:MAG TPA: glutaredoxin family protein [Burkholderiales bacterium]|nr:glutaredoxin family protein [Burkholderiales bacterium]